MGRSTKKKEEKKAISETRVVNTLICHSQSRVKKSSQDEVLKKICFDMVKEYKEKAKKDLDDYPKNVKTSNKDKLIDISVRHYFAKFKVAKHIESVWHEKIQKDEKEFRLNLYFAAAGGESLYRSIFKDFLTKKEVHVFSVGQYELSYAQYIWYAVARSYSDDHGFCLRIAKSKISEGRNWKVSPFWREVVMFFARERSCHISVVNDLFDFFVYKHNQDASYSLKGRNLDSVLKQMEDWHRDLRRLKDIGGASWSGFDSPDFSYDEKIDDNNVVKWTIAQLKTAKDLQKEGNAMRHCVSSYVDKCIKGRCSIWSMKSETMKNGEKRHLTIEVNESGRVIQVRGFANRLETREERSILTKWMKSSPVLAWS